MILFPGKAGLTLTAFCVWFPAIQRFHGFQYRVLEKAFQNGEVAWLTSCPAQSPGFPETFPADRQGLANSWLTGGWHVAWLGDWPSPEEVKDLCRPLAPCWPRPSTQHALNNALYSSSGPMLAEPPPARLLSLLRLPVSPRPTALPGAQAGGRSGWFLKISCAASSLLFKRSQCLCFFLLTPEPRQRRENESAGFYWAPTLCWT